MFSASPPHREHKGSNNGSFWSTLVALIFGLLVSFAIVEVANEQRKPENNVIHIHSLEIGKSIGREAAIQYILEKQDTLTIDFFYLLEIEDSIQKSKNLNYEH